MSTSVAVNTHTHTATYLAAKMMLTLKELIRETGLKPENMCGTWMSLETAIAFYLRNRTLRKVILEVCPAGRPVELVGRWDLEINYTSTDSADGGFWVDTNLIKYSIAKAGAYPSTCTYHFVLTVSPGAADPDGWGDGKLLSTDGFKCYSLGLQIGAPGAGVETHYWTKK